MSGPRLPEVALALAGVRYGCRLAVACRHIDGSLLVRSALVLQAVEAPRGHLRLLLENIVTRSGQ